MGYNDCFYKSVSHKGKYHHCSEKGKILQPILFWGSTFKYISWHKNSVISDLSTIWKEHLVHHFRLPLGVLGNFLCFIISKQEIEYCYFMNGKSNVVRSHGLTPSCLFWGEKLCFSSHFILLYKLYQSINEKEKIILMQTYLLILILGQLIFVCSF